MKMLKRVKIRHIKLPHMKLLSSSSKELKESSKQKTKTNDFCVECLMGIRSNKRCLGVKCDNQREMVFWAFKALHKQCGLWSLSIEIDQL